MSQQFVRWESRRFVQKDGRTDMMKVIVDFHNDFAVVFIKTDVKK